MKWRGITEEEVAEVLEAPERQETTEFGRINAYRQVKDRRLKVTFREESGIQWVGHQCCGERRIRR